MIPTTTGRSDAKVWKGYEYAKVKDGRVGDLEVVRADDGALYSRWKTESWKERLAFLWHGHVWIAVLADKQPGVSIIIGKKIFKDEPAKP